MARFDVYANPDPAERRTIPFFLDIQSDHLEALETRVVVPLHLGERFMGPVRRLNPELIVIDKTVVMDTASIGAIPIGDLRRPVANLADQQSHIQDALDTLFGAY
ncbi:CcdB family protein [Pseudorhodoferax sp. Leaf274]|uniref:CcdB family protein n=1 Tax=Pseudorhodoferax sp. Leaf274 TaxID=1736318 RepID=UPI00070386FB|nr:CcdB family protein [Pseudorhodoferax sp. Leaf274]KQP43172.1 plasmid maintenance protein CcdB [Pseudorhodoferax sp. Leaf274]